MIIRDSLVKNRGEFTPALRRDAILGHLAFDASIIAALPQTQGTAQNLHRRLRRQRARNSTILHRFLNEAVKGVRPAFIHDALKSAAERAVAGIRLGQNLAPGTLQQFALALFVRHFETRRDIGFERKQMQQPFAKGMDRLDF